MPTAIAQSPCAEQLLTRDLHALCRHTALAHIADSGLREVLAHHLRTPGSTVRGRLALEVGGALGISANNLAAIGACVELLHSASLVHDDLQDKQGDRRGQPSVWAKFGNDAALIGGDVFLAAAFAALAGIDSSSASLAPLAHRAVAETASGQALDRSLAGSVTPTFTDYRAMAELKCGPLFGLAFELCFAYAGDPISGQSAAQAARHFAVAYQLADDIADHAEDECRGSINAVLLVQNLEQVHTVDACRTVRAQLADELWSSLTLARRLPHGTGAPLTRLATELLAEAG